MPNLSFVFPWRSLPIQKIKIFYVDQDPDSQHVCIDFCFWLMSGNVDAAHPRWPSPPHPRLPSHQQSTGRLLNLFPCCCLLHLSHHPLTGTVPVVFVPMYLCFDLDNASLMDFWSLDFIPTTLFPFEDYLFFVSHHTPTFPPYANFLPFLFYTTCIYFTSLSSSLLKGTVSPY